MIPSEINVCGVPYTVKLCEDNFTTDSHFGEICYTNAEIRINKDLPDSLKKNALIHEWVHGALVMIGRNEETQDEQLVQSLAMAIGQTFDFKETGK